jgi:hypothetical protein
MNLTKKMLPALALTLLASANFLNADVQAANQTMTMKQAPEDGLMGTNQYNAPSARQYWQDVKGDLHVANAPYFDLEVLAWYANAGEIALGTINNVYSPANPTAPAQASAFTYAEGENLDFKWDAGFRLGFGYTLAHDSWDVYTSWTRFHTDAHKKIGTVGTGNSQVFYPFWSAAEVDVAQASLKADGAHASCKLKTDILDVELGRKFFTGKWFSLRPHVGLRSAWIENKLNIKHYNLSNTSAAPVLVDVVEVKSNFEGVGLRAGVDSEWNVTHAVSFYGDFSLSTLYGRHKNKHIETIGALELANEGTTILDYKNHQHATNLVTDLAFGVNWAPDLTCVCPSVRVVLSAGWEHHLFLNQVKLKKFDTRAVTTGATTTPSNSATNVVSDLALQGFNVSARLEF